MTRLPHALALLLAASPIPAMAQGMPVHDSAGLLQHVQAVRQAIEIVRQGKAQIEEAKKLYQDLNKLTDIPRLAKQLKSDALRELDTSPAALDGFGKGNLDVVGAARGKAEQVYRGLLRQLGVGGSDPARAEFDREARDIGLQAGLAATLGGAAASRGAGLEELRGRLDSAATSKEIADLTARLQLESAAMQNDQLRLQAIAVHREADERARAAAGRAALAQKMEAARRYYRGEQ
jgi:type IV secretion system protein VirB5